MSEAFKDSSSNNFAQHRKNDRSGNALLSGTKAPVRLESARVLEFPAMAPRANWKGFLRLSLVTCPVALYPATSESEKISFNQLNRKTGHRIKYAKVDADTGEEVANEDIHVDMDAFYASVEQRDSPELRGKPVAVGGSRERGVVAAASYEARKFGVRSAMPSITAQRQCPDLIFVKPRFDVYTAISQQIRAIFAEHTPIIEPLSLDEAYLDVTDNLQNIPLARDIALTIRAKIKAENGLNASAGISYNKFLANLASDHRKPNGQYVITPEMGPGFVETRRSANSTQSGASS